MRLILLLSLFALAAPLCANAAPPPDNYEVVAPGGDWVLKAHRRQAEQRICRAGSDKTEWSFNVEEAAEQTFHLSKDGSTVAVVGPWWIKTGTKLTPAVRLMRRTGVFAEFEHQTLAPKINLAENNPGWLWSSEQSGNILIIKSREGTLSRISLETGKLLGQETFEVPQDEGYCTTSPMLSIAFAAFFAAVAALSVLALWRGKRAT